MSDEQATNQVTEATETEAAQIDQGGAPEGNQNAIRHGLRASSLPAGCAYIEGQVKTFRRYVRDLLEQQHGNVTVYQEAVLQSAIRHEQRALLASRWLRIEKELDLNQKLALTAAVANASDARDKCLQKLGLDTATANDPWQQLQKPSATPPTPEGGTQP